MVVLNVGSDLKGSNPTISQTISSCMHEKPKPKAKASPKVTILPLLKKNN
jgi:hypothetical protein